MLTIYFVHTAPSMPSQTVSHMLPAAQAGSTDNTSCTHPPQTTQTQPQRRQSVYTSINESMRAIDSDVYENDSVMNVPLQKNVECSSQASFFSEMIYYIINQRFTKYYYPSLE